MPYKCLKCGSEHTKLLTPKRFEAEAVFYKDDNDNINENNIAFGTKEENVKKILSCKKCNNFGSPSDKSKFSIVEN